MGLEGAWTLVCFISPLLTSHPTLCDSTQNICWVEAPSLSSSPLSRDDRIPFRQPRGRGQCWGGGSSHVSQSIHAPNSVRIPEVSQHSMPSPERLETSQQFNQNGSWDW